MSVMESTLSIYLSMLCLSVMLKRKPSKRG